jgi:hypothetical protein
MVRTYAYSISLLLLLLSFAEVRGQDTIEFPLKIRIGMDIAGPVKYFSDKNILNIEGFASIDRSAKRSIIFGAGYLDYQYSQYNYSYLNNGIFMRAGMEFNILKPEKSQGKYWTGVGLSYGISRFSSETPFYKQDNYWGSVSSSIPKTKNWGHYLEVSPGVKAEMFKNFSMGWSISVRALLYTSTGKDLKPVYFPGYGSGTKAITSSFKYFLVWNIPYKKIKVIKAPPPPKEEDEETAPEQDKTQDNSAKGYGNTQQGGVIRQ